MQTILVFEEGKVTKKIKINNLNDYYVPSNNIFPQNQTHTANFDKIKLKITILNPTEEGNFIISRSTSEIVNFLNIKEEEIKWRKIDEVFPKYYEIFGETIETINKNPNLNKEIKIKVKDDNKTIIILEYCIFKLNDAIIILNNNFKDFRQLKNREQQIFDNSQQGICIFQNNKIVKKNNAFINGEGLEIDYKEAIEKKYISFKNTNTQDFKKIVKNLLNNKNFTFEDEFKYTNPQDGKNYYYRTFAMHYIYHNKPSIKVNFLNTTKKIESEINSKNYKKDLEILQELVSFEIFTWKINEGYTYTPEIYKILEITENENSIDKFSGKDYILFNSLNPFYEWLEDVKKNPKKGMHFDLKFLAKTQTGKRKYLSGYYVTRFNEDTDRYDSIIGFLQDITDIYITERQLKSTLREKEALLKELHERATINLEVLLSIIKIDAKPKKESEEKTTIQATSNRIQCLVLIQKEFSKSKDFNTINISKVLEKISNKLLKDYKKNNISLHNEMENLNLEMEHCTSLCLIITELVLNVIDSAFPNNKQGNLYLKLNKIKDKVKINVIDDGIGLPKDFNIHKVNTTGFFIINNLINQLNGTIKNIPEHKGTNIEIMFPEKN